MNITLKRREFLQKGIFGDFYDESNSRICSTLEHAYGPGPVYTPKLPVGVYKCVRGQHRLHTGPLETFEVTKVPNCTGIVVHQGNYNDDSEGCILVGDTEYNVAGHEMITNSKMTFAKFLKLQDGLDSFILTVI